MKNLMIDLETLGTEPDAPIISIGAVFFDKKGLGEDFQVNLDINQQIKDGRKMTGDTFKWWLEQENAAKRVFKESATSTMWGLQLFYNWAFEQCSPRTMCPWGNGATFDISIMENILNQYDVEIPWRFWNIRDLRTFKEYVHDGKNVQFQGTPHNALDDAKHQARMVIAGLNQQASLL